MNGEGAIEYVLARSYTLGIRMHCVARNSGRNILAAEACRIVHSIIAQVTTIQKEIATDTGDD